jgi:hypothetical protein
VIKKKKTLEAEKTEALPIEQRSEWAEYQWLRSLIFATWKAEIGWITVWGQHGQIVWETPSPK